MLGISFGKMAKVLYTQLVIYKYIFLFLHAVLFYFKLAFDWKVITLLGWNQKAETRINGACHSIQNSIQSVPTMDMGIFLSLLATLFNEMGVLSFSDHSKFHNLK